MGGRTFSPATDVTVSSVTATLLAAANPARVALNVHNNDAAIAIRIGDSTATAAKGDRLVAGGDASITATGPIYGFAESGSPVVSLTEETN
jgi:hypothetical protein